MRDILNTISFSLIATFLFALTFNAYADGHGDKRYYMGIELGIVDQEEMDIMGRDNDVPTRCDAILRSLSNAVDSQFTPLSANTLSMGGANGCLRGQDFWETNGDFNMGILGGLQFGYKFGNNWRAELEYIYRNNNGGDTENTRIADVGVIAGKDNELTRTEQAISTISSQSLFANLYYDFTNMMPNSKFTPFIGAGAGWSKIRMDYTAVFQRNDDPEDLPDTTPDVAAGTTTHTRDTLTDTSFGWQVMAGADYDLGNDWSIGVKVRYMHFDDAKDTKTWDSLRGHDSAIASDDSTPDTASIRADLPNFDPTVEYTIDTDDITVWGVGINLKYAF